MDYSLLKLVSAILPIYIIIGAGYFLRRNGWTKPEADSSLIKLSIDATLPCFIFYNMLGNEKLRSVGYSIETIALGIGVMTICYLSAWTVSKLLRLKVGQGKRTFIVATGSHNYGFFIIAFISILFAANPENRSEFLGLLFTHNVGCDLVFWSLGLMMISNLQFNWKIFVNGPILSVLTALVAIWTGIDKYIPDFAVNTMGMIGGIAIPLNLIMFGNIIYDFISKVKIEWGTISAAVLLRMGFLPLIFVVAAVFLPIDISLKELLLLQAIPPCGVTTAVLAKHFGGRPELAVQIILATSIVSVITAPFWFLLGNSLIK